MPSDQETDSAITFVAEFIQIHTSLVPLTYSSRGASFWRGQY